MMQTDNSITCTVVHVNGVMMICSLLVLASHVHFVMDLNELFGDFE